MVSKLVKMTFAIICLVYSNKKIVVHKVQHIELYNFLKRCLGFIQLQYPSSAATPNYETSNTFKQTIVVDNQTVIEEDDDNNEKNDTTIVKLEQEVFDLDDENVALKAFYVFKSTIGILQQFQLAIRESRKQKDFEFVTVDGAVHRSPEDEEDNIQSYYKTLDWNFLNSILIPLVQGLPRFQEFVRSATRTIESASTRAKFVESLMDPFVPLDFLRTIIPERAYGQFELIKSVVFLNSDKLLAQFAKMTLVSTDDETGESKIEYNVPLLDTFKLPTRSEIEKTPARQSFEQSDRLYRAVNIINLAES